MCHPKRRKASKLVAGLLGAGGAIGCFTMPAFAAEPTTQELMDQIQALQSKVQQLETVQSQQSSKPSAQEVDSTVRSVLKDADNHSQMLEAGGFTAGVSKGKVLLRSEDGNFEINPYLFLQVRYVFNYRDENANTADPGTAQTQDGLELRRARFGFQGHAFSPDLEYNFQWETSRSGGSVSLLDAMVRYRFADEWWVKGGQFKDPTFHEFGGVSGKRQLAVDRSLLNSVLGGGATNRIQAIGLQYESANANLPIRAEFGYTDGPNTLNTNFTDGGGASAVSLTNPNFGAYGRAEYKVMGDWASYDDFSAMGNQNDLLVIGAGAFYGQAGDAQALWHTIDVQAEFGALSLYGAYIGVYSDPSTAGSGSNYDLGFLAQAGYMVNSQWEVFGRYSYISLDSPTSNGEDNFHELTAGVNYYLHGHNAKFTFDVNWYPNGTPGGDLTSIGVLTPDASDDQITFRAQFQLLI